MVTLLDDMEEEMRVLQEKLTIIDQKKLALLEAEGGIRTQMQHLENQIWRQKKLHVKNPGQG